MRKKEVIFSNKHPSEMYLLAITEMCQRFAYWGIGNLLVLLLVTYFKYGTSRATHLFGAYTGIAFILPLLGGFICDKWNYKSPIYIGMFLTVIGSLLLATLKHSLIVPSIGLVALGGGLFTPAIYSLLGTIYSHNQHIREGGFSIYYSSVNIGTLIAMIILGYLHTLNWSWVFYTCAFVQIIGFIPYIFALKKLKKLQVSPHYFRSKNQDPHHFKLKRHEIERIIVILIMTCVSIFFWTAYNQVGSSLTLFALNYTDRNIGGFEVPTPWVTCLETLFLIIFAFPLAKLYLALKQIRSRASPPMKTALSLFFMGLCFLVMEQASRHIPQGGQATPLISPGYLVVSFALMALAELLLAPIGLSLVTNLSPHRYRGLLTGVWFTCIGTGFYLGGYFAGFINKMSWSSFFQIFVFVSFIPAFILVLFANKLDKMRHIDYL